MSLRVYDNAGKTFDRYTAVIDGDDSRIKGGGVKRCQRIFGC